MLSKSMHSAANVPTAVHAMSVARRRYVHTVTPRKRLRDDNLLKCQQKSWRHRIVMQVEW